MSCSFSLQLFFPKSSSPSLHHQSNSCPFHFKSRFKAVKNPSIYMKLTGTSQNQTDCSHVQRISRLGIQFGAFLATAEQPALAVTGVNNPEDLTTILIQGGFVAFWYFLIMPPIIMNWLRIRWYRRNLLEMYLQFMCVFLFFPGVMLWAPFINFRKFPRDPSLKYPWSTPQDPSKVKNTFYKYPFAQPEDYE